MCKALDDVSLPAIKIFLDSNHDHAALQFTGPLPILGDKQHAEMVRHWKTLASKLPSQPKAIVLISGHHEVRLQGLPYTEKARSCIQTNHHEALSIDLVFKNESKSTLHSTSVVFQLKSQQLPHNAPFQAQKEPGLASGTVFKVLYLHWVKN